MLDRVVEVVAELGQAWIDTTELSVDQEIRREEAAFMKFPTAYAFDFGVSDGQRRWSVIHFN